MWRWVDTASLGIDCGYGYGVKSTVFLSWRRILSEWQKWMDEVLSKMDSKSIALMTERNDDCKNARIPFWNEYIFLPRSFPCDPIHIVLAPF